MPGLKLIINRKAEKENKKSLGFQKNGILEVYMVTYKIIPKEHLFKLIIQI